MARAAAAGPREPLRRRQPGRPAHRRPHHERLLAAPIQGWCSEAYGTKDPNWALEYSRGATGARFVTLLASGPYAATHPWITQAWLTGQNARRIQFQAGAASYTLTLVAQGSPNETLSVEAGLLP